MNTIAVITSTRAEYGLLHPLIAELRKYECDEIFVELVVTGTHLIEDFGCTIQEIINDDIRIDEIVRIPMNSQNEREIAHNQAVTLEKFTDLFIRKQYDSIVILGDRYEMLSVAIAAGITNTIIVHLCGGDTTEGAIDEWIRHSITKMSYLHFPTNEESKKRIIQMGENPDRVFNYGSTSMDNIVNLSNISLDQARESVGLSDNKYALCTYHPVTMDRETARNNIFAFLSAIEYFSELEFIVTKANADQDGEYINQILDKAAMSIKNLHVFASLGADRYLSLMKNAEFVLGNSSSGIIEAPCLGVPTVNIGDRQRGRIQTESIIDCKCDKDSIIEAIKKALSPEHKRLSAIVVSPYGDGNAAKKIAEKIIKTVCVETIDVKKSFYSI